jgi:hypothetical protein
MWVKFDVRGGSVLYFTMYFFLAYLMTLSIGEIKWHLLMWQFMSDTEVICRGLI